jgi:hypothetical protein
MFVDELAQQEFFCFKIMDVEEGGCCVIVVIAATVV